MKTKLVALAIGLALAANANAQKVLSDGIKDLASQISGSIAKEKKTRIAVVPFRELDGRTTVLGTYLAEELVTDLFNLGNVDIVERAMLDKVMGELKLSQSGAIDPETAKKLGKVAGVEAIITGSITDLQSFVGINCRLIDAETGRIFAAAQTKIVKDDDVKKVMGMPMPERSQPTSSSAPPGKAANEAHPIFENERIRVTVAAVRKNGSAMRIEVVIDTIASDQFRGGFGGFYLLDENGDRWEETENSKMDHTFDFVPGTRIRHTFAFTANALSTGVTFTMIEQTNFYEKPMIIRGIHIE